MREIHMEHNQEYLKNLIIQAKNGDSSAFEEVYTTYYTPLFRYIRTRTKTKEEAEDITQTTFMKIWNALPTWDTSHTSPRSFFFTVARNTLIDSVRKNSYKEIVSDEIIYRHAHTEGDTDTTLPKKEDTEIIQQALGALSPEQEEFITLYYMDDLTYSEIADITGKREDALRQLHSRAVKKLREIYTTL